MQIGCYKKDDLFKSFKLVNTITDELEASDSKAIQMFWFTMKCKKAKEWYKTYIPSKIDSMTGSSLL